MASAAAAAPLVDKYELVKRPHGILKPIDKNELSSTKRVKYKVTEPLVAPVEKVDVPDHLLNTKIYAKLQRNQTFEVVPVEVHFAGFEVDPTGARKYEQTLRVINISSEVQRMVVLPPKTKHFTVHYTKPERLVPGFSLDIKVIFKPDEYRYFKDAVRIYSEGDENLYVPIHAYPIVSTNDLPTKYAFPNLPIGKSLSKVFNMRSTAPVEFEYMIEIVQKHPAFEIEPLEGIIPYNKDAIVKVTFSPREFCTATMTVQILVSQFNSKPIVCKFYGTSTPGMSRDLVNNELSQELESYKKTLRLKSQLGDSSQQRALSGPAQPRPTGDSSGAGVYGQDVAPKPESFVDFQGYRFPKNLASPWAVSKVLLQKKGKLSLKDIRESKKSIKLSAQIKENLFLQKVKDFEDEERRNQLKWQVKQGEEPIDDATREEILRSRAKAEYEYRVSMGVPVLEQELNRQLTVAIDCRTIRPFTQLARGDITFDEFKNQTWDLRYMALDRFVQSARKIIMKLRLGKVLVALKKFIKDWMEAQQNSEEQLTIEIFIETYYKKLKGHKLDDNEEVRALSAKTMGTYYFPQVAEQRELTNQRARHCEKLHSISKLDSLGQVAAKPIDFSIKTATPYAGLNVPVLYKLNEYKPLRENNYVPKFESRVLKLRAGAEDELTKFDSVQYSRILPARDAAAAAATKSLVEKAPATAVSKQRSQAEPETSRPQAKAAAAATVAQPAGPQVIEFKPLRDLYSPFEYPPMHIFNSAPGVMSYQKLLPYSGVDLNYHLNPLPQFVQDQPYSTQKRFLDREEIIKGLMQWKKFPSQGLISLSNTPTLTDVWVPRWSNVFGTDVMPVETPPLLAGLPEADKKILAENSDPSEDQQQPLATSRSVSSRATKDSAAKVQITPESVNAQFNIPDIFESRQKVVKEEIKFPYGDKLPSTNMPVSAFGQVPRDLREQELEYFLSKQYNGVGLRLSKKLYALDQQVAAAAAAAASSTTGVSTSSVVYDAPNEADESMNDDTTTTTTAAAPQ